VDGEAGERVTLSGKPDSEKIRLWRGARIRRNFNALEVRCCGVPVEVGRLKFLLHHSSQQFYVQAGQENNNILSATALDLRCWGVSKVLY